MNSGQLAPIPGYACVFGDKKAAVCELAGPTSYATGGQTVAASALGWGGFDYADVSGFSHSGTFFCRVQYLPVDATPSAPKQSARSIKVLWYVTATGAEVANAFDLDSEIVRLFALGL